MKSKRQYKVDYRIEPDRPWLQAETIYWLEQTIQPDWTVLETGCGGSTVFFAQRVGRLISYEHDRDWFERVKPRLLRTKAITSLRFEPDYPTKGIACCGPVPPVDMALIDGRGRVKSIEDVVPIIKPGGWLVLDDSQRERYAPAVVFLDHHWGGKKIVWRSGQDQATAWRKPNG